MKLTIIPHNTGKVREIRLSNFLLILLVMLLLVPLIDKWIRGSAPLSLSKLTTENKYLERRLSHYQEEYRDLTSRCDSLLSYARSYQSITQVATGGGAPQNPGSIEGLLADLKESSGILDRISEKLKLSSELASRIPSISPCLGYIIQTYGNTEDIFTGEKRFCQGVDFAVPEGSEVYATASGAIKFAGFHRHSGLMVEIEHGYGFLTKYSHLRVLRVRKYQRVRRGEIIGFVGTTGKTTGPRLHYEVWKDGEPRDPLDFILAEVNYF